MKNKGIDIDAKAATWATFFAFISVITIYWLTVSIGWYPVKEVFMGTAVFFFLASVSLQHIALRSVNHLAYLRMMAEHSVPQWRMPHGKKLKPKDIRYMVWHCNREGVEVIQSDVMDCIRRQGYSRGIFFGDNYVEYNNVVIDASGVKPKWKIYSEGRKTYQIKHAYGDEIELRAHELGYNDELIIPAYKMIEPC